MGVEAAQVAGDAAGVLANAQAGGLMVHDPDAKDGVLAGEHRAPANGLVDKSLSTVRPGVFLDHLMIFHPADVAALAA